MHRTSDQKFGLFQVWDFMLIYAGQCKVQAFGKRRALIEQSEKETEKEQVCKPSTIESARGPSRECISLKTLTSRALRLNKNTKVVYFCLKIFHYFGQKIFSTFLYFLA